MTNTNAPKTVTGWDDGTWQEREIPLPEGRSALQIAADEAFRAVPRRDDARGIVGR